MDILFICDSLGPGGAERVISTLSNEFVKQGNTVGILMMSYERNEPYYSLNSNIKILRLLDNRNCSFFKKSKKLRKRIKEYGPDIVIAFLSYVCIYTWLALRKTNIPYVVSERSNPNQRSFFKQFLMNKAFKNSKGCVFQTNDALSFYKKVGYGKSVVIHNPVNVVETIKCHVSTNKIVAVGSLVNAKNFFLLLDSFAVFKERHSDFILKIYGDGPLENDLKKYVERLKLLDVEFLHKSKTWQEDEADAKIFALSSYTEGMPNVLEEALCLGIPSVSTDCPIGGPKELKTIFKERLILCNNNDVASFVNGLEKALLLCHQKPHIPDCLKSYFISELWLSFLKKAIK